jgi:hypothetical protein
VVLAVFGTSVVVIICARGGERCEEKRKKKRASDKAKREPTNQFTVKRELSRRIYKVR